MEQQLLSASFMVKVLLLEDDSHYRGIIERILASNYPYAVTSVATEDQVREELSKDSFDLVLQDLYIDGRRSWETLKRAVGHPGKPPVIVFSCEDTRANAAHAVSLGAHAFLSKPFDFARLKTTIDSALGSVAVPHERRFERERIGGFRGDATDPDPSAGFRVRLKEEFDRALRHKKQLTLVLLSLSDPKTTTSPRSGDSLLADASRAIRKGFRGTDIFGLSEENEIAVLIPETRTDQVIGRIRDLREKVETDLSPREREPSGIAVRVGLASVPFQPSVESGTGYTQSHEEFFRMAHLALDQARRNENTPVAIFGA